jgi:hypothetical protein
MNAVGNLNVALNLTGGTIYSGSTELGSVINNSISASPYSVLNRTVMVNGMGESLQSSNKTSYCSLWMCPYNMTVGQLGFACGAANGTERWDVAVYDSNNNRLVYASGTCTTTGYLLGNATAVSAGTNNLIGGTAYWVAWNGDTASSSAMNKTVLTNGSFFKSLFDAGTGSIGSISAATAANIAITMFIKSNT